MIYADTGFFLALAQPRDALYSRARKWAQAVHERLLVSEYVVWETVNGLSKPVDRTKAHHLVSQVRSSAAYEWVNASNDLLESGLRLHRERKDKDWSLTDCISFVIMRERAVTKALAHDRSFEQSGFEALLRRDP